MGDVTADRSTRQRLAALLIGLAPLTIGTDAAPARAAGLFIGPRGGVFYEPSVIPDETLTPLVVDLDRTMLSLGPTYALDAFEISERTGK